MSNENILKTGTTTVGILGKDCVVLAADKRVTAGHLIADKNVTKIMPVSSSIAITIAGSVADIQLLTKVLKAELKIKDLRNSRDSTVKEAANLLGGMQYRQLRSVGGAGHFLIAGFDKAPRLYDIFVDGSVIDSSETGFVASGSGTTFAYGLIEDLYKKSMTEDEAVDLAVRAVHSATKRDTASGQGVDVVVITKDGIKKHATKKIQQVLN